MFMKYSFLCALPRTGATFLGSIMNQSKQIQMTPNSIVPDIFEKLFMTKQSSVFQNFPYHAGIDTIISNVFHDYYARIDTPHILDKGTWGTPAHLQLLQVMFKERKFVVLVRPVLEILASFARVKDSSKDLETFCDYLLDPYEGVLGKNIWGIENLIKNNEKHIVITYDNLIKDPQRQLDRIFYFLDLKKETFKLSNIDQFKFAGMTYDDSILDGPFHKIRVDSVKKLNYNVQDFLPEKLIKKYENISIRTTGIG